MPLLDDATHQTYGYHIADLSPKAQKLIVFACDTCGKVCTRKRRRVTPVLLCQHCACSRPRTAEWRRKFRETMLQRYGVTAALQSPVLLKRMTSRNREKYGYANVQQVPEIAAKTRATNEARYGAPNVRQNAEITAKAKRTMLEKYGAEHARQAPLFQQKAEETTLRNHGVRNPSQIPGSRKRAAITTKARHGTLTPHNYGGAEQKVHEWLLSLNIGTVQQGLVLPSGRSIDLLVVNHAIGIEYCGLYWHHERSPTPRTQSYHRAKMLEAAAQGIRLITIFEDEWLQRRGQAENALKAAFNITTSRIGARECALRIIPIPCVNDFLAEHHLQGPGRGTKFAVGLYQKDELLGALTMGVHHRQNQAPVVLSRLCFKAGVYVAGGASRLFTPALAWARSNNCTSIVSWSDNRWFSGTVYEKMGLTLVKELPPDYTYVNCGNPVARISKQSQEKKKTGCPPGSTELEWAHQRGFARIWDCGHKRWELRL